MAKRTSNSKAEATAANVGYEAQLWQMADALRNSMDAAENKHVILGLLFLKYISDTFEEQQARLVADKKSSIFDELSARSGNARYNTQMAGLPA